MKDLTGFNNGHLTIKRFDRIHRYEWRGQIQNRRYWICICGECGNEVSVVESNILNEHTKSCGCVRRKRGAKNKGWKGCGDLSGEQFRNIVNNAKAREIEFDLTIEFLWELALGQKLKCALTGVPLVFDEGRKSGNLGNASLDRVNSDLPYVTSNVRWVLKDVNLMKHTFSDSKLLDLCLKIINHSRNGTSDPLFP